MEGHLEVLLALKKLESALVVGVAHDGKDILGCTEDRVLEEGILVVVDILDNAVGILHDMVAADAVEEVAVGLVGVVVAAQDQVGKMASLELDLKKRKMKCFIKKINILKIIL